MCVCVCVCVFIYTISIVCVSQEEPSLKACNQQIYDFKFLKRKDIVKKNILISVNYSFHHLIQEAIVST